MHRWFLIFLTASATLVGASAMPSPAEACGNSMHRFKERRPVRVIHNAWYQIREKNYEGAIGALAKEFHNLDELAQKLDEIDGTHRRALHAMAVSVIRSEGTLERAAAPTKLNGNAARQNVIWATRVLQQLAPSSDEARSHHAEALALDKDRRSDARVALESLASKKLIPDAEGWKLLASLRAVDGDNEAAQVASAQAAKLASEPNPKPAVPRARSRSKSKSAKVHELLE